MLSVVVRHLSALVRDALADRISRTQLARLHHEVEILIFDLFIELQLEFLLVLLSILLFNDVQDEIRSRHNFGRNILF